MVEKKGVYWILLAIAALSVLFTACIIVKQGDSGQQPAAEPSPAAKAPAEKETLSAGGSCDDSADGGNNPYAQGTTKVTYNKKVTVFTDTCNSAEYLTEYYCDGGEYKFYSKLCTYGCSDGACLQGKVEEAPEQPAPEPAEEPEEQAPRTIPECFDGFRDLDETDTDCGGPNCKPCAYGKHCETKRDCVASLTCNQRNFLCLEVVH